MNIHKHTLTYALATVFVVVAISLSIYLAGSMGSGWNYLSYLIYTVVAIFALKNWREKAKNNVLSYGQAMGYSTLLSLYYSLMIGLWTFIFMVYIAPDFMESMMAKQEAAMEAKNMPPEQIEMAMKYMRKFSQPAFAIPFGFLGNMIINTIINLIVSAFMKKDADDNLPDPYQNSSVA